MLTLHYHPLSSFCHKVLIALYENETPCRLHLVDLGNETSRSEFLEVWPVGKFPVLRDDAAGRTVPESSIIIEYLDQHFPGGTRFIPADPDAALRVRELDRLFDLNLHIHMQKVVTDRLRPPGKSDSAGVEQARHQIETTLGIVENAMTAAWVAGTTFSLADCAAAPALFYSNMIVPLQGRFPRTAKYLDRLKARASYARVLKEAEPYFAMMPK